MNPQSLNTDVKDLQFARALRRWWWVVAVCFVIGAGVAFALAKTSQKQYTATSSLLFQQSAFTQEMFGYTAQNTQDPTTEQSTYLSLASQSIISVNVSHRLRGILSPGAVSGAIKVSAPNEGNVIDIAATRPSPVMAAHLANVYAHQVIAYQKSSQQGQVRSAARSLANQLSRLPKGSSQIGSIRQRLNQLDALASLETGDVQVAGPAVIPTAPSAPKTKKDMILGALLGLIIGLLALVVLERRDVTIRDTDDAVSTTGDLALIGQIPLAKGGVASGEESVGHPSAAFAEAFRLLRAQLRYFTVGRDLKSIMVTSSMPGDGKSTVAWNLAVICAQLAPTQSILIIDSDLRRARIADLGGLTPGPGLSEVLSQHLSLDEAVRQFTVAGKNGQANEVVLHVLAAGGVPPNPSELLESREFSELLHNAEDVYDLIIVDTSPISMVSDAIPVTRHVSGVVVVTRVRRTRRAALRSLAHQLSQLNAPTLGLVVNGLSESDGGYGYGYGGYYGTDRDDHLSQAGVASESDTRVAR